ncbi:hypothetical protein QE152_g24960 [Popillia japonica]|uniref:Uncharacterized protein n=1 Tax=Popillia japonica TaxID=7064 RepID=A0AAW1K1Z0_POPJA
MSRKRIQQLRDPELEYDAANKKYIMEIMNKLSKDISSLENKLIAQLDRKIIDAGQHVDSLYAQTTQMVEGALNISITKNETKQKKKKSTGHLKYPKVTHSTYIDGPPPIKKDCTYCNFIIKNSDLLK